jgi:5-methylthioadenosine/S-adenosylhomocysteine deaminase
MTLLIEGGHVLTLDPQTPDVPGGSVLIEGERIAAIGASLEAPPGAEVVDATGHVVMPGFVDTHRHTWQTALRGICGDWTLTDYFLGIRSTLTPRYTPDDLYAGNLAGALEGLDAGVTTLVDFSHCNVTPEHPGAAVAALGDAGIRAVFAYGFFAPPAGEPAFADHAARIADARRVAGELPGGLVRMGVALTEVGLVPWSDSVAEIRAARELDVPIVAHTGCVWGSQMCMGVQEMGALDLLGPDQIHVHCNCLSEDELALLARADAKVSCSPETELQMGMGKPILARAMAHGMRPSLSCDIVSLNSGDMFTQMRMGLQFERAMANDVVNRAGDNPLELSLSVRDALAWATRNGAEAAGLGDRVGMLRAGMDADVIVVGSDRIGMVPQPDPVGAMVVQAGARDVRDVLVAGRFVKRDGVLVSADVERAKQLVRESSERILGGGFELPPPPEGFADALNAMAAANLAAATA